MDRHPRSPHFVAMYVLIGLLAIALAYTAFRMSSQDADAKDAWVCSRAVCGQYVNPDQWVAQNCAPLGETGAVQDRTCTVNIEGTPTAVPLAVINLTYVAQQCEVVTCVQEVRVRDANYTVPGSQ